MHDNLAQLERKVSQLAKTKRRDSRTSLRSKIDRSTDGGPAVSRGASLLRKASFRRSEDQEPATETDQEPPQPQPRKNVCLTVLTIMLTVLSGGPRKPSALPGGKRKRSLSLPKFGGENKIRM